ncbi:MAG: flavin reductase [Brumimicrobium sp.]|nr:flavin reductase [Brumimicrobium sp.]
MDLHKLDLSDIQKLEKHYRAALINSVSGVKSANLIGTKDRENRTNLAIFSSVIHLGSNPALLGFVQRPASVERHTYENIIQTERYTINAIHSGIIFQAHQTSARYDRDESEFDETSLEAIYRDDFFAPFVKESPLQIAMHLEDVIPIKANDTKLIIGSIQALYFQKDTQHEDGSLSLEKSDIVGITGLDTYMGLSKHIKLSYAKPDEPLKKLS